MGISYAAMRALIIEAKHKSFSGVAATLGRQTMSTSIEGAYRLFEEIGVAPRALAEKDLFLDKTTSFTDGTTISDISFFKLLGFDRCQSIDVSGFEGAEIICDLNKPVSEELDEQFDLIVDGSLLDNIWNPATGLQNISRMLKPNGRCLAVNMGNYSAQYTGIPYTMFTPNWFFDFFAVNHYADCRVYAVGHHSMGPTVWYADLRHLTREFGNGWLRPLLSSAPIAIYVFAEKAPNSTHSEYPTQHIYRPDAEWKIFEEAIARFISSGRGHLFASTVPYFLDTYASGWVFIRPDGAEVNPYHQPIGTALENYAPNFAPPFPTHMQVSGWVLQRELIRRYSRRLKRLFIKS